MEKRHLRGIVLILIGLFILSIPLIRNNSTANEINSTAEVLIENLDTVWAIDFLPDGRMIFTERPGVVNIYDGKEAKTVAGINITERSESGLMGIAVDPGFNSNNFIYLYYTYEDISGLHNKISRFVLINNGLSEETTLLDNIPSAIYHDGGRLKFGPDGKLYATTGDATVPSSSQDITSLAGKILRMNKDGSIPEDNPFNNYVWSYGHRNPQGLAWGKDILYAAEHGPIKNDEVNIIEKGKNYGWPNECTSNGDWINPIRCFTEFTLAPAGIAFYNGNVYVAGLRGTQLRKLTIENGKVLKEEELFSDLGRIREVVVYNGYLYIGTSNYDGRGIPKQGDDKIIKVKI